MQESIIFPEFFFKIPIYLWYPTIFFVGAAVGSFLNVCIYRLPKEKSPFWPLGSHCGRCFQPIRWCDNIPLISYWWLRGRCRVCGGNYSIRYFFIELFTALAFVGLFQAEVVANVHQLNVRLVGLNFEIGLLTIFIFHTILICFLLVATFCDIDGRTIPLSLTITGTLVGVVGGVLWPWPWPYTAPWPMAAPLGFRPFFPGVLQPFEALQPWPLWNELPRWLAPGTWQLGLANSVAGLLVGTLMIRAIRFVFGLGMGPEFAEDPDLDHPPQTTLGRLWDRLNRIGGKTLGLGDADLMMMAGAFLGWQPVVLAFFVGVIPGMIFGMTQMFYRNDNALPFGPALAVGIVITMLCWRTLAPTFLMVFFNAPLVLTVVVMGTVMMLIAGYVLRLMRRGDDGKKKE